MNMFRKIRLFILAVGGMCLAVAVWVNPPQEMRPELLRYGLEPIQATCISNRLMDNLSVWQLRRLNQSARAYSTQYQTAERLTFGKFISAARNIEDPKVHLNVSSATIRCGVIKSELGSSSSAKFS